MKRCFFAILPVAMTIAGVAQSQERIEINNVYPINQEHFELSDRTYTFLDNRGYFEVVEGPFEEGPARCIGGGDWYQDGTNTIGGICIFGEGDDTFTIRWQAGEQGAANSWVIAAGTGRYEGMTGEGIATLGDDILYHAQARRKTHIVGSVSIPVQ